MKILNLIVALCLVALPVALAPSASAVLAADPGNNENDPGVECCTCWEDDDGNVYSVDVRGNLMGESVVTVTDAAGNTGSGAGTPDPDGGCADSPEFSCGSGRFQVKDGELQKKNANGDFKDMDEVDCPKKKKVELNGGSTGATDTGDDDSDDEELSSDESVGGWPIVTSDHVAHP